MKKYGSLLILLSAVVLCGGDLPMTADFRSSSNPADTGIKVREDGAFLIISETSEGRIGNAASNFSLVYPAGTDITRRINEVLAKLEGSGPVDFEIAFSMQELERADRMVHFEFGVRFHGGKVPRQWALAHLLNFRDFVFLPDQRVKFDSANTPALRFRIEPSGGKHQVDKVELLFSIRVDTGGAPETVSVGEFAFRSVPVIAGQGAMTAKFTNFAPSAALLENLGKLGYKADFDSQSDGDILFIAGRFRENHNMKPYLNAVKAGKTIFVDLRDGCEVPNDMAAMLPVNPWSLKLASYKRMGSPLKTFPGSFLKDEVLYHSAPYDLHVPGSPIENSMMRYLWDEYEKSLDNTDWQVLLCTAGGMPILLSGQVGAARVYVFGGDSEDRAFVASAGYRAFCQELVRNMSTTVPSAAGGDVGALEMTIPRVQSGELYVEVRNTGRSKVDAFVAFQVSNWEREILNKQALKISLNGNESKRVVLPKRGAFKGDNRIHESGSSVPYLRLRAALLSGDRAKLSAEQSVTVFTGDEVSISIAENPQSWPDRADMAQIDGEFDGSLAMLSVRPVNSSPEITITVNNRLAEMGPLATAVDETASDNLTIEGLNDLSLSRADARHKGKWAGGWAAAGGDTQNLRLNWEMPVTLGAYCIEALGSYRNEHFLNPKNFTLTVGNEQVVDEVKNAVYENAGSTWYARLGKTFAPVSTQSLKMNITGINTNRKASVFQANAICAMRELSVMGWPGTSGGKSIAGSLEVTAVDLATGSKKLVARQNLTVKPYTRESINLTLPPSDQFGAVRYEIEFKSGNKVLAREVRSVLYLEPGRPEIFDKKQLAQFQPGVLCTPGWYLYDSFGRGMVDWTRGWGGPHDQIWALAHGLMETGFSNNYAPDRMMTTNTRNSHYSNPWRFLPDGSYGWDLTADVILEDGIRRYPEDKGIYVGASDRWNGIPVNNTFGWDMYVRFDEYLRETRGEGLKARSAKKIANEIITQYADVWQQWQMEQYARKIEETRQRYAAKDRIFYFETHGSFPLAGGELGGQLGKTHLGVGTDLFWELRNQDMYWTLGSRFGVVAANPDLRSGLYKQWGWVNSEANRFWFANNSSTEPSRRQWYSTYYMGRIDTSGQFNPYHVMGYSLQGGISTKFYPHEIRNYARTFQLGTKVRPEQAAGFGMVVSWSAHQKRMRPDSRSFGFGLFAAGGAENQIDYRMGRLYERLAKHGLPIGFVTSSHALKNYQGNSPLILVDGSDWSEDELDAIRTLNQSGTPVIAFAGDAPAPALFTDNARTVKCGSIDLLVSGNKIYCPLNAKEIPADAIQPLIDAMMKNAGFELRSTSNMPVTPFINSGALFLAFGSIADYNRVEHVVVRPESLLPGLDNPVFIDLDNNVRIPAKKSAEGYTLQIPAAACDGRLIMIKNMK